MSATRTASAAVTPPRLIVVWTVAVLVFVGLGGSAAVAAGRDASNVVLVMCDDLGWGDVGFNGGTTIQTPHLDAMAANGLKFNRWYAAAPVCSPTRGSVVTGRHPFRYGIYTANKGHLKEQEFTLYEALKTKGYRTGHFGKWHMGTLTTRIRDANRGKPGNTRDYSAPWHHQVDVCLVTESKVPTWDPMIKPPKASRQAWHAIAAGEPAEVYGTYYWTGEDQNVPPDSPQLKGDDSRVVMDAALGFVREAVESEAPFFTIVWFHAPHLPVVAGPEFTALYPGTSDYEANYYGCITALDRQVGRLRESLRELGVAENTLVAFCSDNGPEGRAGSAPGTAGPFSGRKRDLLEGGIRVPGLIEWPAVVKPGRDTDIPCGTVDYFPTIMAAAGFKLPDADRPMDGVNLLPLLDDDGSMTERPTPLGFQSAKQVALSDNRYKIWSKDGGENFALFDLIEDPAEQNDVTAAHPDIAGRMIAKVKAWQASCRASDEGVDY